MERLFVMRWNPAISSYKLDVFHRNCEDFPDGFGIDWSVWEYNEAHCGDHFVMVRVGDYKPGIVFYGTFISDPYADDDWADTGKKRHYVMMDCFGFRENDDPIISADVLQSSIPGVDWMHGHSGELLGIDVARQVTGILESTVDDFSFCHECDGRDKTDDRAAVTRLHEMMGRYASCSPSIHSRNEEGYDWLESYEEWSRCLLIPNPRSNGPCIEVEANGELILYFAGAHGHYDTDQDDYDSLLATIDDILSGKECAYSCAYDGWTWCIGMGEIEATRERVKKFLQEDDEYYVRMLAEYTEKDIKPDGIITFKLRFFDRSNAQTFRFKLSELTDKIDDYIKRQAQVRQEYSDPSSKFD